MKNITTHNVVLTVLSLATLSLALPSTSAAGPFGNRNPERQAQVRNAILNFSAAALNAYAHSRSSYGQPAHGTCNSQRPINTMNQFHSTPVYTRQTPVYTRQTPVHTTRQTPVYTRQTPVHTNHQAAAASPSIAQIETAVFNATNRVRAQHGLAPLAMSAPASNLSRTHSASMARSGSLTHNGMVQRLQASAQSMGVRYTGGAENVVQGFGGSNATAVADGLLRLWMNSDGHRRNILSPNAKYLGVGIAAGSNGYVFGTQLFLN